MGATCAPDGQRIKRVSKPANDTFFDGITMLQRNELGGTYAVQRRQGKKVSRKLKEVKEFRGN